MLCNAESLRDVIAFPKTSTGTEPMTNSPGAVTDAELSEMGLKSL